MLYNSIVNYKSIKKNIYFCNFILLKKKFYFIKIKKKKNFFLNIKQIIFLFFLNNIWKNINFKNLLLIITLIKEKIISNIDGYFKLLLISKKYYLFNKINLNNIFNKLKNLVWTNLGCYELYLFNKFNFNYNNLIIESIDKIPFLTKIFIPKNIRISNSNRVRLGSYISEGVTIMSEGYVNFNTYIGNNCMIEGRVSAGIKIGNNTDIGGSSSIMGTLSGGGVNIISIGSNCLLGANSGIGISIGNNCIVEAGTYITSGVKIFLCFNKKNILLKAKKLSFVNNLIFYRNSINGRIECCKNYNNSNKINLILHKN